MRIGTTSLALILVLLAACGPPPSALVRFSGITPQTSLLMKTDNRMVKVFCAGCGNHVDASLDLCPDEENCGAEIVLKDEYVCPFCEGRKDCATCVIYQKLDSGDCYNCNGIGYLTYNGKTAACPNCGKKDKEGDGDDPVCRGSKKCDYCDGEGIISGDQVKAKQVKPGQRDPGQDDPDAP